MADKKFAYDAFLINEEIKTKQLDEKTVLSNIENKSYSIIQLNHILNKIYFARLPYTSLKKKGRFTENIFRAIGVNYHLERISDARLFYAKNNY